MGFPPSAPDPSGVSTEKSAPRVRRRSAIAAAALLALVMAAAGYWASRLYDPGPSLSVEQVTGVQVAVEGWETVDLEGSLRAEIEAFVAAASDSKALWPPDLLFP